MTGITWRCAAVLAACLGAGDALAAASKAATGPAPMRMGAAPLDLDALRARFGEGIAHLEKDEAAEALRVLDPLLAEPAFARFEPAQRAKATWIVGIAAWRAGDARRARDRFQTAVAGYGDDPEIWESLATVEQQLGNRDRASLYFAKLLARWPDRMAELEDNVIGDLVFFGRPESDERLALMQALFDAGWNGQERGASGTWSELALALIARGQLDRARAVVARVEDPLVAVDLRADLRFDPIADAIARLPAVEAIAVANAGRFRERVARHPQRVDLLVDLGAALLVAGRNEDALAEMDRALALVDEAEPASLEKLDERVWLSNNRAIALRRLGRVDEAAAELERARRLGEHGSTNVSQSLNLGMLYCHMGRARDARRVVEELGPLSDYGEMVERSVRHCIAMLEGDAAGARRMLEEIYDHRSDGEGIMLDALLRAGDADAAAAELIRQLASPTSRDAAFDLVHSFRTPAALPGTRRARATREIVLRRPDVQAAIAAVGRAGRFEIYDSTGIE